jgi:hypothetical protein
LQRLDIILTLFVAIHHSYPESIFSSDSIFTNIPSGKEMSLPPPLEKGDQRGICEAVNEIPPTPLFEGGLLYDYGESGRTQLYACRWNAEKSNSYLLEIANSDLFFDVNGHKNAPIGFH